MFIMSVKKNYFKEESEMKILRFLSPLLYLLRVCVFKKEKIT